MIRAPARVRFCRCRNCSDAASLNATAFGGDHVLQRPALLAGEHRGVQLRDRLVIGEDHTAPAARPGSCSWWWSPRARTAPGWDAVAWRPVRRSAPCPPGSTPPASSAIRRNAAKSSCRGVRRPAGDDQLRAVLFGQRLHRRHVDQVVAGPHVVRDRSVELAGEVDPHPVWRVVGREKSTCWARRRPPRTDVALLQAAETDFETGNAGDQAGLAAVSNTAVFGREVSASWGRDLGHGARRLLLRRDGDAPQDRGAGGTNRWRGRASRTVLVAYWLVSGYGQRAWRSLAAVGNPACLVALDFQIIVHILNRRHGPDATATTAETAICKVSSTGRPSR